MLRVPETGLTHRRTTASPGSSPGSPPAARSTALPPGDAGNIAPGCQRSDTNTANGVKDSTCPPAASRRPVPYCQGDGGVLTAGASAPWVTNFIPASNSWGPGSRPKTRLYMRLIFSAGLEAAAISDRFATALDCSVTNGLFRKNSACWGTVVT